MSQTTSALLALRELLLSGELAGGERLLEVPLAERLGMSRTPVRTALARLAAEGLLEELTYGGYVVRRFGETDVHEAIEMRGALEGLAARFAAEKKPTPEAVAPLAALLDRIDAVLGAPQIGEGRLRGLCRAERPLPRRPDGPGRQPGAGAAAGAGVRPAVRLAQRLRHGPAAFDPGGGPAPAPLRARSHRRP